MIETTQTVPVGTEIAQVWNHVRNIRNWAELMPGLQNYEIIDDDVSRWVLKVGLGALVRTVKVEVHVHEWDGPGRVLFSFKLQGDPVTGSGTYMARQVSAAETEMSLSIQVEGSGPMAPMWEAMGAPLLPKFALAFARQLSESIEQTAGVSNGAGLKPTSANISERLASWMRELWRSLCRAPTNR